ncbi:unnamed protein product [Rhizopus stolonifer]
MGKKSSSGFLRPSDIQRIDDSLTTLSSDNAILTLAIDCPKEKRQGQRIQHQVHIQRHPYLCLCSVQAYLSYKSHVTSSPLIIPYPTQPQRYISCLLRKIYSHHTPINSQIIDKHINRIMYLIPSPECISLPRARALGSTSAATDRIPIDYILAQGSWASSSMYDTFYRLCRVCILSILYYDQPQYQSRQTK